ncbi:MAG: HD domain-containing protein [Ilumatobacter sp.]|nr:HD domain-containing protein [Ilumatobacter sp.]
MEQAVATLEPVEGPEATELEASPIHPEEQAGWTARPGVALLLRSAIFLAPVVASIVASYLVASNWPRPSGLLPILGWLAVLISVGGVAMITIDRIARRFLPLAALMRMTLIFPDQAPSRFTIALRTGTTKQLESRLAHVRQHGLGDTEAEAAETLLHLAAALREHDRFTRGHGERVRAYTALIGEEMGLDPVEISKLQWAGLIHDIGKLAIPEEVLNKPGRLTPEEYDLIKTHPAEGMALMGPLTGWLGEWALAVGEHHERWDGNGYPNGLAGTEISLAGRIVAVADTFDVITATRSYKPAQSPQWARRELANNAGSQFDPEVVRAFLNLSLGQLRGVMWPLSWIGYLPFIGSAVTAPASGVAVAAATVVGSSVTGGSLAGAMRPDDGLIPHTEGVPVEEVVDVAAPGTTAPVVVIAPSAPSTTIMVRRPVGDLPTTISTTPPAEGSIVAPATVVVTLPSTAGEPAGGFPEAATGAAPIVIIPPVERLVPVSGGGTTTTGTTTPVSTTPAATGGTGGPATTVATPTTAIPTTTAAPTTTPVATPCEQARSGATSLAGADLASCDLSGVLLDGVDLTGADLFQADLTGAKITNVMLDGADLANARLDGAVVSGGSMLLLDGTGLTAIGATFDDVDLSGSLLRDADFEGGRFTRTSLASIDARDADFESATFEDVTFDGASMPGSDFDGAVLVSVSMQNVAARDSSFQEADMHGTDLRGADLRDSDFQLTDLRRTQLDAARINRADLELADFRDATGVPVGTASAEHQSTVCPDGTVVSTNCWP